MGTTWARHGCAWVPRLATAAAALCPALSSLGGALVGALIALVVLALPRVQHGHPIAPRVGPAEAGEGP